MKKTLSVLFLMGVCFGANLADIQKDKVIKIGVRMDQTPFSAMKNGSFEGFEVELAKAVAKKIAGNDVKIELIGVNAKDRVPFFARWTRGYNVCEYDRDARAHEIC